MCLTTSGGRFNIKSNVIHLPVSIGIPMIKNKPVSRPSYLLYIGNPIWYLYWNWAIVQSPKYSGNIVCRDSGPRRHQQLHKKSIHYNDVTMSTMASQITSVSIVYLTVCSDANQRKHQSSASLAFVWGIHRWPVNSPHKGPVTLKMFPFHDVIMPITDLHGITRWQYANIILLIPRGRFNKYSVYHNSDRFPDETVVRHHFLDWIIPGSRYIYIYMYIYIYIQIYIWVRSRNCSCLVTWFCYW